MAMLNLNVDKILAQVIKSFDKVVKSATCNTGALSVHRVVNHFSVQVENDGQLSDYLGDVIRAHPYAHLIEASNFKGSYDWSSDTYVRDCTVITFRIAAA